MLHQNVHIDLLRADTHRVNFMQHNQKAITHMYIRHKPPACPSNMEIGPLNVRFMFEHTVARGSGACCELTGLYSSTYLCFALN